MTKSNPLVSVIITNAKGKKLLIKTLETLEKQTYRNYEVIVVDCLTEDIFEIKRRFPQVGIVHFDSDIGASASHNVGILKASKNTKYYLFLDNDVLVPNNFISSLVDLMERDEFKNIAIIQPMILNYKSKDTLQSLGYLMLIDGTAYPLIKVKRLTKTILSMKEKHVIFKVLYPHGAAFMVRRGVIKQLVENKLPMYHNFFFIGSDDMDFGWRSNLMGLKVAVTNITHLYHLGGATSKISKFRLFHEIKNRLSSLLMNFEIKFIPEAILLRLVSNFYVYVLRKPNKKYAITILKAYLWVIKNLKVIIMKRKIVQNMIKVHNDDLLKKRYILSKYDWIRHYFLHDELH